MPSEPPPPQVLALLVADHVHRDDISGKLFILGTRSGINAAAFPFHHPGLAVYAALTEGRGETEIQVRLIDVDEEREPVFAIDTRVAFSDPIVEMEVAFLVEDLIFPEPGDYRAQLLAGGQVLAERRIRLPPLENPGEP
jgi:hypothetical protein